MGYSQGIKSISVEPKSGVPTGEVEEKSRSRVRQRPNHCISWPLDTILWRIGSHGKVFKQGNGVIIFASEKDHLDSCAKDRLEGRSPKTGR